MEWKGISRNYRLHVPVGGIEGKPLMVVLHGYGDHPRLIELYTGFSRLADEKGFGVLYPYGTNSPVDKSLSWNAGLCCGSALLSLTDDVNFISLVTEKVVNDYGVDKSRVYLVGFSNGAFMAQRVATETQNRFSGLASVAGTVGGQTIGSQGFFSLKKPETPIDHLMYHGLDDPAVPYTGGQVKFKTNIPAPARVLSFAQTKNFWLGANRCLNFESLVDESGIRRENGVGCTARTVAVSVPERGHVWLGGFLETLMYGQIAGIDQSTEIWRFFDER